MRYNALHPPLAQLVRAQSLYLWGPWFESMRADNKDSVKKDSPSDIWQKLWPVLNRTYKRSATFLDYRNPWELLVSVILSAQTTDDGVNKVTKELFKKYPKPKDLANASLFAITQIIRSIGYYNSKARYIKETAKLINKKYKCIVPQTEEELRTLPGVGRKTAVVVLSNAFEKNVGIPVDTHVIRFAHRFHLSQAKNPDRIESDLQKIIPQKYWKRASYAIKEYGRKEGRARGYDKESDPLWQALQKNTSQ